MQQKKIFIFLDILWHTHLFFLEFRVLGLAFSHLILLDRAEQILSIILFVFNLECEFHIFFILSLRLMGVEGSWYPSWGREKIPL